MKFKSGLILFCVSLLTLFAFSPTKVCAVNLVVNGDFETGDFTGWTTDALTVVGEWFVYSGTTSPLSLHTVLPPPQGTFAAITDMTNPSSMVLYQDIVIPSGFQGNLTFVYYYQSFASLVTPSPETLQLTTSNQQARVDIMNPATVDPFSVAPGDVLANVFQTQTGGPVSVPYTTITFDMSPFAGQTIRLRFAVADNNDFFLFGVDEVSIIENALPPTNLKGREIKNKFVTQTDCIHRLTWSPSPDPTVIAYNVYRNGALIATIPATDRLRYDDHNRCKKVDTYSVTAVSPLGESSSISVTIL